MNLLLKQSDFRDQWQRTGKAMMLLSKQTGPEKLSISLISPKKNMKDIVNRGILKFHSG